MLQNIKGYLIRGVIVYLLLCLISSFVCYFFDLYGLALIIAGYITYGLTGLILGFLCCLRNDSSLLVKSFIFAGLFIVLLTACQMILRLIIFKSIDFQDVYYVRMLILLASSLLGTFLGAIKK